MVFYCIIYVFDDVFIVKILGKIHFLFAQPVLIQRILQMPDDPDPENRVIDEPDRTQNRRDQIHRKNQIDQTENDQRLFAFRHRLVLHHADNGTQPAPDERPA